MAHLHVCTLLDLVVYYYLDLAIKVHPTYGTSSIPFTRGWLTRLRYLLIYLDYLIPAQLLMGVLRLGFITIFLSEPLISGYTTGAACHVFTSQLTHITGVSTPRVPGFWFVPLVSEIDTLYIKYMYTYIMHMLICTALFSSLMYSYLVMYMWITGLLLIHVHVDT
jgi:hypothetical protein